MATVDGFTAAYMQTIVDATIVGGSVDPTTGHLTLTNHAGGTIDGGNLFPNPTELGGSIDLDTITTTGRYTQSQNAEATSGIHYPIAAAGMLEVVAAVGGGMVWQRYTPYNNNAFNSFYARAYYSANGWSAWKKFSSDDQELLLAWPVGSIYMSVVNTNPGTIFGGTWAAWGTGRMPIGVNAADTRFDTVEETGGTDTITATMVPAHTHPITGPSGADAAHTHTITGPSGGASADHTHNQTNPLKVLVTNTLSTATGSTDNGGSSLASGGTASRFYHNVDNSGGGVNTTTGRSADHTHTLPAATNAGSSHTHTLPANTGSSTAATASLLPPYISVYMWKRTA